MSLRPILLSAVSLLLAGCDLAALLADPRVVQREAEGKAIGSACRYAVRGIEDCYTMNEKALKTAIFAGWKEMDQYMRENKIEGQPSKIDKAVPAAAAMATNEVLVDDKKNTPLTADTKASDKADSKAMTKPDTKPKPPRASVPAAAAASAPEKPTTSGH